MWEHIFSSRYLHEKKKYSCVSNVIQKVKPDFCFRFCKDAFDKNYKATIGVDFEMERFEVLGVPFSLQLWVWLFLLFLLLFI